MFLTKLAITITLGAIKAFGLPNPDLIRRGPCTFGSPSLPNNPSCPECPERSANEQAGISGYYDSTITGGGTWDIYADTTYGIEGAGTELALSYICPDLETCIDRAVTAFPDDCFGVAWVDYSPDPGVCYMRSVLPQCLPLLNDGGIRHIARRRY